nr:hypothetical protein [uncultured Campylobacter sp.]
MKNQIININNNVADNAISIIEQIKHQIVDAKSCDIKITNGKTIIKVDNGKVGCVVTHQNLGSFETQEVSKCTKTDANDRIGIVKALYKEGKTQTEIARLLMVSQKTISIDLKKINENKEIKKEDKK